MAIDSVLQSSLQGIHRGYDRFSTAAHGISSSRNQDYASLADQLVEIKKAKSQVESSVAVVKAEDETVGNFLDIFA